MATELTAERLASLRKSMDARKRLGGNFILVGLRTAEALLRAADERYAVQDQLMQFVTGIRNGDSLLSLQAERDRLRAQRDALVAVLEQCDVFLRAHAKPDNELKTAVQAAIRAAKENQ